MTVLTALATLTFFSVGSAGAASLVSQSTASALQLSVGGSPVTLPVLPSKQSATNDGSQPTVTVTSNGSLASVPTYGVLTLGAYSQTAIANSDGTAAACAGLVGDGGVLQLGNGTCMPKGGTGNAATINLSGVLLAGLVSQLPSQVQSLLGPVVSQLATSNLSIGLGAMYATCTAGIQGSAASNFSAQASTLTATLQGSFMGNTIPLQSFTINQGFSFATLPAPLNQLAQFINIAVNQVQPNGPQTSATAVEISLAGGLALDLKIGSVTCGPDPGPQQATTTTTASTTTTAPPAAQTSPTEAALAGIQTDEGRYVPPHHSSSELAFWGATGAAILLVLGGITPFTLRRRARRQ